MYTHNPRESCVASCTLSSSQPLTDARTYLSVSFRRRQCWLSSLSFCILIGLYLSFRLDVKPQITPGTSKSAPKKNMSFLRVNRPIGASWHL
ncbi:uncharacterized protein EURHEDRAFT_118466 [Aspergillus ruber CBS 135680]|uniref:Uncharacterized protein n=1 Tax=Aspergillus ruber (strain CBS 135680) TaxID=1388766 RepID=A0A017SQL5_ASPRC|nr:uncharacterized protein EURHEDRAFT_118466 [Aspergillus ruber CBS 135680]EYE98899.1 hypothetical protein EURHEDRAFT_118466 [Aspergillus ruber CBS 135680]